MSTFEEIQQREKNVLFQTYSRYPLAAVRGKGARLWDSEGKEYIDLLSGIAVTSLGHCNEEVTKVLCEQASTLVHVSNLLYQENQIRLAERLLSTNHFDKAFFCNSGAEANETAIKLARRYMQCVRRNGAFEIITFENAFHGRTLGTLAATGQVKLQEGFAPMPEGFKQVPWNDLAALEAAITPQTAAVMIEMVQGESGIRPVTPEFAKGIEAICRKKDVLFIVDEVQAGMCRSGRFWCFQNFDIKPDIISCAKALANGLPIGAVMATDEVAQAFPFGSHGTTFGGGPLLTAVADKVVEIMIRDQLDKRAAKLGAAFLARLREVAAKHPDKIKEVRGLGLLIGIELTAPGKDVWLKLIHKGFVINLSHDTVLRLLPPLIIEEADLNAFADALDEVLA